MKVTLDLDQLLREGKISQAEYEKFSQFASKSTGTLAFNILIGFGVIAVSSAALALVPTPTTAIIIGFGILALGIFLLKYSLEQWKLLANICILVGALMMGGGIIASGEGNLASLVSVTFLFTVAGILAQSNLLIVLATLMLSATIGAGTAYNHASYFLIIEQPLTTVILFSSLSLGLYHLSKLLAPQYESLAITSSRTGVFLVNFGFWVGSLWGERDEKGVILISDTIFAILWAIALIATGIWGWKQNRRWVVNTVATFGGIHFYTQWFENLGASPGTVLIGGLFALGFAIGLRMINSKMRQQE
jgi:hypothetical protein